MSEATQADAGFAEVEARPDPLRAAFGQCLAALMAALPPGVERDIAMQAVMEAHSCVVAALARRRMN